MVAYLKLLIAKMTRARFGSSAFSADICCQTTWAKAGIPRVFSGTSGRGAESTGPSGGMQASGVGRTRVGLPYSAVEYMTQSAPQSISCLIMADAKRPGIEISPLDTATRVDAPIQRWLRRASLGVLRSV
jgi:hypothetical protein